MVVHTVAGGGHTSVGSRQSQEDVTASEDEQECRSRSELSSPALNLSGKRNGNRVFFSVASQQQCSAESVTSPSRSRILSRFLQFMPTLLVEESKRRGGSTFY